MSTDHSPEPLRVVRDHQGEYTYCLMIGTKIVADIVNHPDSEYSAHRFAATFNACHGIHTGDLIYMQEKFPDRLQRIFYESNFADEATHRVVAGQKMKV